MIDKNKEYKTVSGFPVRIYATDGSDSLPVHGAIFENKEWNLFEWTEDGKYCEDSTGEFDLVEVKPKRKVIIKVWEVQEALVNGTSIEATTNKGEEDYLTENHEATLIDTIEKEYDL